MMCDNLSLYKTIVPPPLPMPTSPNSSLTTITSPFFPIDNDQHRTVLCVKRKFSDYEDETSTVNPLEQISTSLNCPTSDDEDEDDEEEEEEDDEEDEDEDEEEESEQSNAPSPCTIIQRRHSDTTVNSYGPAIVKRRCTYSSMHDEEQKRSVLVESYRKLRGVKKPKLQVSLLICNLIKRLEKTFTKTPPFRQEQEAEQQQQQHVQYYPSHPRTTYRSTSSDSLYMSPLVNDDLELTHQQYSSSSSCSSPHPTSYESEKLLLPVNDSRLSSTPMYHSSSTPPPPATTTTTDNYWLAQSHFAVPVVSSSDDDDDVDISFHGGGDYLDLSDNTLSSSPSSTDCCCSSNSSNSMGKLLVDTNNNPTDDYYLYHHSTATNEQTFFYHQNGNNSVDIITTA